MKTILSIILAVLPNIFPDYAGVTIPRNIAPLNFSIQEEATVYKATFSSGIHSFRVYSLNGNINVPERKWKALLSGDSDEITVETAVLIKGRWNSREPFRIYVSSDPIDDYIAYRLIPPGYEVWGSMGIYQRCLSSYEQTAVAENRLMGDNCMNCHSFANRRPDRFMFHMRSTYDGTYILKDKAIEKINTKTPETISSLVYPQWSTDGRYIAFSVNDIAQVFHSRDSNRVEVFDYSSDVVVYDVENHNIIFSPLTKSPDYFETFPCFSPDGKSLYFCSAKAIKEMPERYREVKYNIMRIDFNPATGRFGDRLETVYDAASEDKSASFPRISPDGRLLLFTLHGYGNFSIWHKDADLCLMDLGDKSLRPLVPFNSKDVESYHSWSSDGRWVVFSSRRDDGLYTKLYIGHIDADGNASKPFLLPQKNPKEFYLRLMYSYNIPEFVTGKIQAKPSDFAEIAIESPGIDISSGHPAP